MADVPYTLGGFSTQSLAKMIKRLRQSVILRMVNFLQEIFPQCPQALTRIKILNIVSIKFCVDIGQEETMIGGPNRHRAAAAYVVSGFTTCPEVRHRASRRILIVLHKITVMAKFLDLATELVLAIISHIPRSADKLHLVLVNRALYQTIIPHLYKHIGLGQIGDSSNKGELTRMRGDSSSDTVRLDRLYRMLKTASPSRNPAVESLALELDSTTLHECLELSDITHYLPSLKSLYLSSKRSQESTCVSPRAMGKALRCVRGTLESLIVDIDQDPGFRDGTGIGTFINFTALKHLGIQSHILLNEYEDHLTHSLHDDNVINVDETILAEYLPPSLQEFQMSCWTDGLGEDGHVWGRVVAILLRRLIKRALSTVPELQEITVYYPIKREGAHDVEATLGQEEQDLEDERLKLERYASKGRWQNVARVLTEMALSEHRDISVKYQQGSPEGSRSWGETATGPANAASRG